MRTLSLRLLLLAAMFYGFVSCAVKEKKEPPEKIIEKQQNDLPRMTIHALDGTTLYVNKLVGKKQILVLFQPDCDHCQNEVKEIKKNVSAFRSYQVYFISAASSADVKKFSNDYNLSTEENFHFATVDVQSILDTYGQILAPSIYIYSDKGKLVSHFNGETNIETVLKSI